MESLLDARRLREIDTWATGWARFLHEVYGGSVNYSAMPMDVATSMISELVVALRDPQWAIQMIADTAHESGQEIAELIEARRA